MASVGHVTLCILAGDVQEVYQVDVKALNQDGSGVSVLAFKQHLKSTFGVLYSERLRFDDVTQIGLAVPLGDGEAMPLSPSQIRMHGPASVVNMVSLGLRRQGSLVSSIPIQRPPENQQSKVLDVSAVSIETMSSNLATRKLNKKVPLTVVFLDVDGVLNLGSSMMGLDTSCVNRLAWLVQRSAACIVLSSTWRFSEASKLDLVGALVDAGVSKDCLVGQTPEVSEQDMCTERAAEICAWVEGEPCIGSWVVLDDMDLASCGMLDFHFVRTDMHVGLTDANVREALKILKHE